MNYKSFVFYYFIGFLLVFSTQAQANETHLKSPTVFKEDLGYCPMGSIHILGPQSISFLSDTSGHDTLKTEFLNPMRQYPEARNLLKTWEEEGLSVCFNGVIIGKSKIGHIFFGQLETFDNNKIRHNFAPIRFRAGTIQYHEGFKKKKRIILNPQAVVDHLYGDILSSSTTPDHTVGMPFMSIESIKSALRTEVLPKKKLSAKVLELMNFMTLPVVNPQSENDNTQRYIVSWSAPVTYFFGSQTSTASSENNIRVYSYLVIHNKMKRTASFYDVYSFEKIDVRSEEILQNK